MRRELLLLEEMIDAAEQAHLLAVDQTAESLASDRQRRDALLLDFTVLGEAAASIMSMSRQSPYRFVRG